MPKYEVRDPKTGRTSTLEAKQKPTSDQIRAHFDSLPTTKKPTTTRNPQADERRALPGGRGSRAPEKYASPLRDVGIWGLNAAMSLPEAGVGLASMLSGGRAGKYLEDTVGFRPGEARRILAEYYSPEQKAAEQEFRDAKGLGGTLSTLGRHPRLVGQALVESAPMMGAGGYLGRAVAALPKIGAAIGAAGGEGLFGMGSQAESTRQQSPDRLLTPTQTALAAATGLTTWGVGAGMGRLATKTGFVDPDTLIAEGFEQGVKAAQRGRVASGLGSGALELAEEVGQGIPEQAFSNLATGRPVGEGMAQATTLGGVTGGVMGLGMSQIGRQPRQQVQPSPGQPQAPPPPPQAAQQPGAPAPATLATVGNAPQPAAAAPTVFDAEFGPQGYAAPEPGPTAAPRGPTLSPDAPVRAMDNIGAADLRYRAEDPGIAARADAMRTSGMQARQAMADQRPGGGSTLAEVGVTGPQVVSDDEFAQRTVPVPPEAMGQPPAPQRPAPVTAPQFRGWQEVMPGEPPMALYDWPIDDSGRFTTGGAEGLRAAGYEVPDPPYAPPGAGTWEDTGDLLPEQAETMQRYQRPHPGAVAPEREFTADEIEGDLDKPATAENTADLFQQALGDFVRDESGSVTIPARTWGKLRDILGLDDDLRMPNLTRERKGKGVELGGDLDNLLGEIEERSDPQAGFDHTPAERRWLQQLHERLKGAAATGSGGVAARAKEEAKRFISDEEGSVKIPLKIPAWARKFLKPAEAKKLRADTAKSMENAFDDLPKDVDWREVALAGKVKKGWYSAAVDSIATVFGDDAPAFARLLAALSPQVPVQTNLQNAVRVWRKWNEAGRPKDEDSIRKIMGSSVRGSKGDKSVLEAWAQNTVRVLSSDDPSTVMLSGPKVYSFAENLLGYMDEVTNDTWMLVFAGLAGDIGIGGQINVDQTDPGKRPGYLALSAKIRAVADQLTKLTPDDPWTPANVQETVWSWAKTLYEAAEDAGVTAREFLESGRLTPEMIADTPEFAVLFMDDPRVRADMEAAGYGEAIAGLKRPDRGIRPAGEPDGGDGTAGQSAGPGSFGPGTPGRTALLRSAGRLDAIKSRRDAEEGLSAAEKTVLRNERANARRLARDAKRGDSARAAEERLRRRGAVRGGTGGLATSVRPDHPEPRPLLEGLKPTVFLPGVGPVDVKPYAPAREAAARYMQTTDMADVLPLRTYVPADPARGGRIADAYAEMEHNPRDPEVKAAYRAMIDETLAQWEEIKKTGLKVEFLTPKGLDKKGGKDPYPHGPRQAILDVNNNNHLWVFPTTGGFGSDKEADVSDNPLLELTGEVIDGYELTANDVFRIVHDYFGHVKEGVGFRADGEDNAWRQHSRMYSPLARRAMTSETRGQNSWLNFGPHGKKNKTATTKKTVFATQKTGLLPQWIVEEGANDPDDDLPAWVTENDDVVEEEAAPKKKSADDADAAAALKQLPGTGEPVTLDFIRNTETAPHLGERFGQDVEPAGRYINERHPVVTSVPKGWETGTVAFKSPLVLGWGAGGYQDATNWKRALSAAYDGKTGEALSKAIAADGYDAVITRDPDGSTNEIVDLTKYEFEQWFGDSVVTDKAGAPLVVYHGSVNRDVESLDPDADPVRPRSGPKGVYFTSDPKAASGYTRRPGASIKVKPGHVTAAHLSLRNPLDVTKAIKQGQRRGLSFGDAKRKALEALTPEHDGVVFKGDAANASEYVAFRADQIRRVPPKLDTRQSGQYTTKKTSGLASALSPGVRVQTAEELEGMSRPARITLTDDAGDTHEVIFKRERADRNIFLGRDHLSAEDGSGTARDVASYRVSDALGFGKLVPETHATEVTGLDDALAGGKLAKFGRKDDARVAGSAMQWVEDTIPFGYLSAEDKKTVGTPEEWYRLYVLDYLIGATDRHKLNLLADKQPGPDGVRHLHAPDNTLGYARISPEPDRPGVKGLRMVGHGAHTMAASADERARIVKALTETDWSKVLEGIGPKAREAFMDRLAFVKKHVEADTFQRPVKYSVSQWRDD